MSLVGVLLLTSDDKLEAQGPQLILAGLVYPLELIRYSVVKINS